MYRSRQIFGGAKDFCPNFSKLARNVFCVVCKDHEDLFWCDLEQKRLYVFFCKRWAPFVEVKQRWVPFLPGRSRILPKFLWIFPGFSKNLIFWGCTCTPASYTTVITDTHIRSRLTESTFKTSLSLCKRKVNKWQSWAMEGEKESRSPWIAGP